MTVSEWDQRQLCPDGGCTGLIGDDGLCRVCGRVAPNWGEERKRGLALDDAKADDGNDDDDLDDDDYEDGDGDGEDDDPDDDDDEEDEGDDEGVIAAKLQPETPSTGEGQWRTRKLCPDGACIGVIGDDGTCKVCGKAPKP